MKITFQVLGLSFEAEIDYTPGTPGRYSGPPEKCYPDEPSEIEFTSLTVDGHDALFMLESGSLSEEIESAAAEVADALYESESSVDFDDYDPDEQYYANFDYRSPL